MVFAWTSRFCIFCKEKRWVPKEKSIAHDFCLNQQILHFFQGKKNFPSRYFFYCKWMMVFAWASRFCFSQGTMMHSSKGLDWDWLSCILFKEICSRIWFERIDIRGRIKLIPDPIFLIPPLLFESNPWSSALSILLPCISLRCNQRALPCSCQRSIVPSLPCSCHRSSQLPPIRPMRRQQFCARMVGWHQHHVRWWFRVPSPAACLSGFPCWIIFNSVTKSFSYQLSVYG